MVSKRQLCNTPVFKFLFKKNENETAYIYMVAYFCHHMSDDYVESTDLTLYVDMPVIYVELWDKKSSKSSSLISCYLSFLMFLTVIYLSTYHLKSRYNFLTSRHLLQQFVLSSDNDFDLLIRQLILLLSV